MKKNIVKKLLSINFLITFSIISCTNKIKQSDNNEIQKFSQVNQEKISKEQLNIVYKYAPIIFQDTKKGNRPQEWDFITKFDFDGDLIGNNNEESLKSKKYKLPATVYYALIESETHYFITYSLFHPLDWDTTKPFIPYTWHENDMENIQVVIRKENSKPIILSTQAHTSTDVLTIANSGVKSGNKRLKSKQFRLLNKSLNGSGSNPAIYVEPGGHGIYSLTSKENKFSTLFPPKLKEGVTYLPSRNNISNFKQEESTYNYQLKSIYNEMWIHYKNKKNIGNGKLMDGTFSYKDELTNHQNIPRHFDSNRKSGPGKSDAGILPFAFSYKLTSNDLGVIFFNPAKKYSETLKIDHEWSRKYIYNPYLK